MDRNNDPHAGGARRNVSSDHSGAATTEKPGKASLHQAIIDTVRSRIISGEWPPGTKLPFEHDLAKQFGCSRMTVNKAMMRLADDGLIERRRKAGTFVKRPQSYSAIMQIADIRSEVEALGLPYHFEILERITRDPTSDEQNRLGSAAPVLAIQCRHFAARQPFCFEDRLINLAAVPDARQADFTTLSPGAWLVSHIPWTDAEYRIRAIAADADIAERLLLKEGTPCLSISRRTQSEGQPITFVMLTYPGDDHEVSARFRS